MLSEKVKHFTESVIRDMTRQCLRYGGVNLAQGFPDFEAPEELKEAAIRAIRDGVNQYAITWGSPGFRQAISRKALRYNGIMADPETQITVTCGATEAMIASLLAVVDPGDEVIVFEPFYENYGPDAIICGATPRFISLDPPGFTFDPQRLAALFNEKTKAIILNTPNNPIGKIFGQEELQEIARLCLDHDVIAVTDEIYEYILYDGHRHISIGSLEGMADRTITISGLSKTFSVTGWRLGYILASERLTSGIRKMHDFLTVGAPAPLQEAAAAALALPDSYYEGLREMYLAKRDLLLGILEDAGFDPYRPQGAYYILCNLDCFGYESDVEFARYLVQEVGVAAVPGSSFYHDPILGRNQIRFTFSKKDETLLAAGQRLKKVHGRPKTSS